MTVVCTLNMRNEGNSSFTL